MTNHMIEIEKTVVGGETGPRTGVTHTPTIRIGPEARLDGTTLPGTPTSQKMRITNRTSWWETISRKS
jgi:hypothetical protein